MDVCCCTGDIYEFYGRCSVRLCEHGNIREYGSGMWANMDLDIAVISSV